MPTIIKCRPCGRPPCGEVEVKHEPSDGEATAVPVPRPSGDDDAPTVKQLKPRPSAQHGTASKKRKAGEDGPEAQRSSISSQPIRPWTGGRKQQGLASTSATGSSSSSSQAPRLENTTDPYWNRLHHALWSNSMSAVEVHQHAEAALVSGATSMMGIQALGQKGPRAKTCRANYARPSESTLGSQSPTGLRSMWAARPRRSTWNGSHALHPMSGWTGPCAIGDCQI